MRASRSKKESCLGDWQGDTRQEGGKPRVPSELQEGNCQHSTMTTLLRTKAVEKRVENQPLLPTMQKSLATFIRATSLQEWMTSLIWRALRDNASSETKECRLGAVSL